MTIASAVSRSAGTIVILSAMVACSPQKPPENAETPKANPTAPEWLGPYDEAQKTVLAMPLDATIEQRAHRTYPDLTRFSFAGDSPISVPDDLLMFANHVSEVLAASPLLYVFRTGPASLANIHALFGPKPVDDPDPWQCVAVDAQGSPSLVPSLPTDDVRPLLDQGMKAGPKGLDSLKQAAEKSKTVPGVQAMLADAALAVGDLDTADQAARVALAADPSFPLSFRILAEVRWRHHQQDRAKEAIARALALYPTYPRAWKVAEVIVGHPIDRAVVVEQPFIEVNDKGAIVVVSCDRPFCVGYASCKAAFRFEPVFRAAMLQEPESAPYHLSVTEEVVCLQAGLGTHMAEREKNPAISDQTAELLIQLAAEKGLSSFALFEILGFHRPEWLRIAPRPVHEALVHHILVHVLGTPMHEQPSHDDIITARRTNTGEGR